MILTKISNIISLDEIRVYRLFLINKIYGTVLAFGYINVRMFLAENNLRGQGISKRNILIDKKTFIRN